MSGGPQHPFHSQTSSSNQYDNTYPNPSYPNLDASFFHQSGHFSQHPQQGSEANQPSQFGHFDSYSAQPPFQHGNGAQSGFQGGHNQPDPYNHPNQSPSTQYGYPLGAHAGFGAPPVNYGAGHNSNFGSHTPSFQASPAFAQQPQQNLWNPQQGLTPSSFHSPYSAHAQSLSPQPFTQAHDGNQQHQDSSAFAAQPGSVAQIQSQHQPADSASVSTPSLPVPDSADSSPQKAGRRIVLKRTLKAQETSSGGLQAQAQLQIEPPTENKMAVGRPTRNAATAATASIHNSFSDSSMNRASRTRQIKQQPGSEEDYEEVSPTPQAEPIENDSHDMNDDDGDDEEGQEGDAYSEEEGHQPKRVQPSSGRQQRSTSPPAAPSQKAKKSIVLVKKPSGRNQSAPPRNYGRNGASRSGSRARTMTPKPEKTAPKVPTEPVRRSTRLSRDSQPPASSQESVVTSPPATPPLPPRSKARTFAMLNLDQQRHLDAEEQDDEDEDADGDADEDAEGEPVARVKPEPEDHGPEPVLSTSRSGRVRRQKVQNMAESEDSEEPEDEDEEEVGPRRSSRRLKGNALDGFVAADDEEEEDDEGEYGTPKRSTRASGRLRRGPSAPSNRLAEMAAKKRAANGRGKMQKRKIIDDEFEVEGDETPEEEHISGAEDDPLDLHSDEPEGSQGKSYSLRQRKKVNYSLVPPPPSPPRDGFGRTIRNNRGRGGNGAYELDPAEGVPAAGGPGAGLPMPFPGRGKKGKEGWDALPSSMSGKDYARIFGDPVDSSDDELQNNALRKPGAPAALGGGPAGGLLGAGGAGGAGGPPGSLTGSGGTDSFGRIKKSGDPLADVDPLGVDMNIDFDSVGGLDGHIQQLKEMVMLPLLYPEVFQRFKVTPPRGVLFHGPPGTGKTLVARALAASCSTEGQQVSFFMRKGADCLSKWVGEAERQLRLLFEEARNSQPSIIFFDEIDGLAPVRSSKQDQIHASIVSTMLALMDGMDGRGQVVVIGATNRPDSVDPALRRPGRFDREFYFPLPSLEARKSIINIHTRKWEPPLDDDFKARLADVTKGYGGADLRALCTEAALNAIQRRYPQIYSTTDRLLLDPASIQVDAKDFMMSVNKIVPSSARASASAAAPLPERLAPLLGSVVKHAISVLDRILPPVSKRNPLEEALWEDDAFAPSGLTSGLSAADKLGGDRGFGREMLLQSFEAQRVYRPRMLVHGRAGMGQGAVGAALLQHLEGYHVQSLDIGTLLGDSARTPEAAIIQLFVEAKRHKPSVLYIPGIVHWSRSVSESVKTTFKALLDGLTDADPVMLLGIAEAPLDELDEEVHSWFNFLDDDIVEIARPDEASRLEYFQEIFDHVIRPPTEFPDALPRRKRVLEELPKAPPRPPRKLTQAELQQQADNDAKLLEHLKFRLGPVLAELRKKFKKFTRDVWDEYNLRELTHTFDWKREKGKITVDLRYYKPGAMAARQAAEAAREEADMNRMLETEADIAAKRGITAAQFMGPPQGTITEAETEQNGEDVNASAGATNGLNGDVEMTNGDAAANGAGLGGTANGVDAAVDADGFAAFPPPSSQVNGTSSTEAPPTKTFNVALPEPAAESSTAPAVGDTSITSAPDADTVNAPHGATTTDDLDYWVRSMPIWTTNLEKMQKRLYYNGYLSCSSFMEDIQKIVENAEEAAEVDQDRVFRAHQMRNLAIVLMDQYIDAGFREECDRMALRQMAREAEAKEATEKAKASAEEAAVRKAEGAKGERASARIAGKEPESGGLEGGKRARSVSGQQAGEVANTEGEGGEEEARKRARLVSPSTQVTDGATAVPAPESVPAALAHAAVPEPASQPEQPAPHPPLTYNPSSYETLKSYLIASTVRYNIDQLSRLRAACFNAIWTHRSEWDRDPLLEKLMLLTRKSEDAVRRELKKTLDARAVGM